MAQGRPALALSPPDTGARERRAGSDPDLVAIIRERIAAAGGRIPFADFMDLALYEPEHGYYLGPTIRSAREGDFLTAPELHPIFGRVLAGQLAEMWELLGRPDPFVLRDEGAGPGVLGQAVLEALRDEAPEVFEAVAYEPIEMNPAHRATLSERFAQAGLSDRPTPERSRPMVGCVVANEFVDALPVHLVEGDEQGRLHEVFVAWREGWFAEELAEPSTPELAAYFERLGITLAPGQRAEANLAMGGWLDEIAAVLGRGYVLVIDYGRPATELYSSRRKAGTLLGYRGHRVSDDPFAFVGRQDLTAHVDVTTLEAWALERGLVPLARTTQARFLVDGGLEGILEEERARPDLGVEAYLALRASIVRLLDPRALGGFQVVLLGRGTPSDRLPSGFRTAP